MTYINNQYLRLDIAIEEIAKLEIKTDKNNKMISDIDIKEYEPNIIIAFGINKKIDYYNIFSSVRILITDVDTLNGKIEEIPDFIEVIIAYKLIYYNKNDVKSDKDFDLLDFENQNEIFEMKVERLIGRGKINSYNNVGDTILNYLITNKKEKKAIELIDKMEIESINKVNKYGYTVLMYSCLYNMENIALKLLEIEEININQACIYIGNTALAYAIANRLENVAIKLLEREDINLNNINNLGATLLIDACTYKMENIALKLLEKNIDINVKCVGKTALDIAIIKNMTSVIKKIKELQK